VANTVSRWKDILWRTYQQIGEDRLLAVAAGVVFYALLALFPAITALVSLYGLFANASAMNDHLAGLGGILPTNAVDIVHEQIARLTAKSGTKLGFGFIIGLGVALWSANAGMKAIMDALNVVYEEKEKRGFIKLNLVSLAFTLAAIASLLVALGAVVVLPVLLNHLGLSSVTDAIFRFVRWPILIAIVIIGLALIYRFGPSRRQPRWQWVSVGSIFAAIAWLVSSALLSWYGNHCRARNYLSFRRCLPAGTRSRGGKLRRSRRAATEEHRSTDPRLLDRAASWHACQTGKGHPGREFTPGSLAREAGNHELAARGAGTRPWFSQPPASV
jgi:YihY family inner membrane protein